MYADNPAAVTYSVLNRAFKTDCAEQTCSGQKHTTAALGCRISSENHGVSVCVVSLDKIKSLETGGGRMLGRWWYQVRSTDQIQCEI